MTPEPQIPLRTLLQGTPIVPAIRDPINLEQSLAAHGKIVFFLTGNLENCAAMFGAVREAGKVPIANIDLMDGLARDRCAVSFLKTCGAQGIITTHVAALRSARSLGLYAVQRTFLVDSGAMDTITNHLRACPVDAVEVLPALVAPKLLPVAHAIAPETAVLGGGLIATLKEAESLLQQGLNAVSISDPALWLR